MARVTVEDCVSIVNNRFELVALASRLAKDFSSGVPIPVARDNDKDTVVALRSIAGKHVDIEHLRERVTLAAQNKLSTEDTGIEDSEALEDIMDEAEMATNTISSAEFMDDDSFFSSEEIVDIED